MLWDPNSTQHPPWLGKLRLKPDRDELTHTRGQITWARGRRSIKRMKKFKKAMTDENRSIATFNVWACSKNTESGTPNQKGKSRRPSSFQGDRK